MAFPSKTIVGFTSVVLIFIIFSRNLTLLKQSKYKSGYNIRFSDRENYESQDRFCGSRTEVFWDLEFEDANNSEWPWNVTKTSQCPNYHYNTNSLYRRKVHLDCSTVSPRLVVSLTNSPRDVQVVKPGDQCLNSYINTCCNDQGMPVPNLVHYVWYSDVEMNIFTFASLIGVLRFVKPCLILFHGPYIPKGKYWNFFIGVYPYVLVVNETLVTEIFGQKLKYPEHGADIMRISLLREHGGIYLDWDEVIVRPIEPLRKFTFTMSFETPNKLGNQFIMAAPNTTFLSHYYNSYRDYRDTWSYNSITVPFELSQKYPELINRLPYTALIPKNSRQGRCVFENLDWSTNYALHCYLRWFKRRNELNIVTIRYENTTLGSFIRFILLGKKEICEN